MRYVLHGAGSGSLGELNFEHQPFVLDMEGLVRHLDSGFDSVRMEFGLYAGLTWFRQDPLSRMVMRIGGLAAVALAPAEYQLLAVNPAHQGAASSVVHEAAAVSFCAAGSGLMECQSKSFFQVGVLGPIEFGRQDHRVGGETRGVLHVLTTHGILRLSKVEAVLWEVLVPEFQPPFYASH